MDPTLQDTHLLSQLRRCSMLLDETLKRLGKLLQERVALLNMADSADRRKQSYIDRKIDQNSERIEDIVDGYIERARR